MVTAEIKLWNKAVGAVLWDENTETASFQFFPDFIASGQNIAPLTMPLNEAGGNRIFSFPALNPDTFHGLPGLLADSLPDKYGTTLIDAWLARNGRTPDSLNPVERLCYIGRRGMGALEFEPSMRTTNDIATNLEIAGLVEMAKDILSDRKNFATNLEPQTAKGLEDIIKVGSSAGGARAKAIIAYNSTTNEVRSGQVDAPDGFEHWLIKFDGVDSDILAASQGYGRIEYAYYKMAIACGIEMMECRLYEEEQGRAHFMTKRFDRVGNKDKVHVQTLCGLRHFDFKQPGLYSYEQAFQAMRELRLDYTAAEQMFRRMAFNVMARNCDDHTKNIAFLMSKEGVWSLAPAYDMSHAFNPKSRWIDAHNITLNGKRDHFVVPDLLAVAKQMNIKKAREIIGQVFEVIRNWNDYAEACGVKSDFITELGATHLLLRP
jgi:serine/threonine-protein kinase HipA